jgi:hypothetical protein
MGKKSAFVVALVAFVLVAAFGILGGLRVVEIIAGELILSLGLAAAYYLLFVQGPVVDEFSRQGGRVPPQDMGIAGWILLACLIATLAFVTWRSLHALA